MRDRKDNKWYPKPTSDESKESNNVVSTSTSSNSNSTSSGSTDSSNSNSTKDASGTSPEKRNESPDMFASYTENSIQDSDQEEEIVCKEITVKKTLELTNLKDTDDSSPSLLSINEEGSYDDDFVIKSDLNERLYEEAATTNENLVADSFPIKKSIGKILVKKTLDKKTAKRSANDYCCEHVHLFIPGTSKRAKSNLFSNIKIDFNQ